MKAQHERLEREKIKAWLTPRAQCYLGRLDLFETLDSTNTYLLAQAKSAAKPAGAWVCLAEEQTKGRGRLAKVWASPYARHIYCSLAWPFPLAFKGLSALSIAAGVCVLRALQSLGLDQGLGLKWPNDLYYAGRKLAGILIENRVSSHGQWVVLGVGLNVSLPPGSPDSWTDIETARGAPISRNQAAGFLINALLEGVPLFEAEGLSPFLAQATERDLLLHQPVRVSTPQGVLTGQARGLNDQGELLVMDDVGLLRCFSYGEVSVSNRFDE